MGGGEWGWVSTCQLLFWWIEAWNCECEITNILACLDKEIQQTLNALVKVSGQKAKGWPVREVVGGSGLTTTSNILISSPAARGWPRGSVWATEEVCCRRLLFYSVPLVCTLVCFVTVSLSLKSALVSVKAKWKPICNRHNQSFCHWLKATDCIDHLSLSLPILDF